MIPASLAPVLTICRHCGETIHPDQDGTMVDRDGEEGCTMAERHEAV